MMKSAEKRATLQLQLQHLVQLISATEVILPTGILEDASQVEERRTMAGNDVHLCRRSAGR
jgi:hypothetical protein